MPQTWLRAPSYRGVLADEPEPRDHVTGVTRTHRLESLRVWSVDVYRAPRRHGDAFGFGR